MAIQALEICNNDPWKAVEYISSQSTVASGERQIDWV